MDVNGRSEAETRFLSWVLAVHGQDVQQACQRILNVNTAEGGSFAPLDVLDRALNELYGAELRDAEAVGDYAFDDSV